MWGDWGLSVKQRDAPDTGRQAGEREDRYNYVKKIGEEVCVFGGGEGRMGGDGGRKKKKREGF